MIHIFKRWYEGKTEIQYFDDQDNEIKGIYVLPLIYTEYHWTAQAARQLTAFYLRNWQFIVGTIISIGVAITMNS